MSTSKKGSWAARLAAKVRSRSKSGSASSQSSKSGQSKGQGTTEPRRRLHQSRISQHARGSTSPRPNARSAQLRGSRSSIPSAPNRTSLWSLGYAQMKATMPGLIKAYESVVSLEAGLSPLNDSTAMQEFIEQQLSKVEDRKWKLQIGSQSVVIREQIGRLARAVMFAKDFISPISSSEPHAGLAWAGVCLILPLLCRPEEQDRAMIAGLNSANAVLYRFAVYERLYMENEAKATDSPLPRHVAQVKDQFEKASVTLIADTIELQARVACQCSRNGAVRYFRDVFHADDWAKLSEDIEESDSICMKYIDALYAESFDRRMKEQTGLLNAMSDSINSIVGLQEQTLKEIRSGFARLEKYRLDGQQQKILNALWTSNYENHLRLIPKRVPNTCRWFTDHQRYQAFKDSEMPDVLWLSADPGCGKSVISRALIEEDLLRDDRVVCYFFFRAGNSEQNTLLNALAALTHQLIISRKHLIGHVERVYGKKGEAFAGSVTDLWKLLINASADERAGEVVCVIDALDECEMNDCEDLIGRVTDLYKSSKKTGAVGRRLKFVLTSRPYRDIHRRFQELLSEFPSIRLSADTETPAITAEIDLVIDYRMEQIRIANDMTETAGWAISNQLKSMKGRTYLWLKLILDAIDNSWETSKDRLEGLIESLPSTIYESYQRILSQRRGADLRKARRIFQMMLVAKRPLKVTEMSIIMALDDTSCRNAETRSDADHVFREKIRHICGLLVIVEHEKIYFMHQTVREFLLASEYEVLASKGIRELRLPLTIEESQFTLFHACSQVILYEAALRQANQKHLRGDIDYVLREKSQRYGAGIDPTMSGGNHYHTYYRIATITEFTLLEYAATFWFFHASEYEKFTSGSDQLQSDGTKEAFETRCEEMCSLSWIWWPFTNDLDFKIVPHAPVKWPKIITMAFLGFEGVLKRYLSKSENANVVDAKDNRGRTALSWVGATGNKRIAEILISHGADVNATDIHNKSPLYYATSVAESSRDLELMEYLVECGANDPNALSAAIEQSKMAAEFLFEKGFMLPADADACHHLLERCEYLKSRRLYMKVVKQLFHRHPPFTFTIPEIARLIFSDEHELAHKLRVASGVSEEQWTAAWKDTVEKWRRSRWQERYEISFGHEDKEDPVRVYPYKYFKAVESGHDFGQYLDSWRPYIEPQLTDPPTTPKLARIMKIMMRYSKEGFLDAPVAAGMTLLCMAARYGNWVLWRHLVLLGANATIKDDHGYDAISYAANRAHIDCVDLATCNAHREFYLSSSVPDRERELGTHESPDLSEQYTLQFGHKRPSSRSLDDLVILPQGLHIYGKMRCVKERRWIALNAQSDSDITNTPTQNAEAKLVNISFVDAETASNTAENARNVHLPC